MVHMCIYFYCFCERKYEYICENISEASCKALGFFDCSPFRSSAIAPRRNTPEFDITVSGPLIC